MHQAHFDNSTHKQKYTFINAQIFKCSELLPKTKRIKHIIFIVITIKRYFLNFFQIIREDKETLDNIPGNHNTLIISPWEYRCTDLESEHSEERTHHAFCKAEPEQYKDPCLEWVPITRSPSQGQLRQVSHLSLKKMVVSESH